MQYDLSLEDVNVCKTKNAKSNQLAFGVMLSFFKRYTQFPMAAESNISSELILQVAKSLDIDPLFITTFDWSGRNAKKYRQEIRKYLGYRVTNAEDIASIINYLVDNLIPRQLSDSVLLEQTRLYFSKNKIEIVSTQQLEGYISANKDLVTVFSLGSEGPDVGVMGAIESQGKAGQILHYGFDYTDTWLKGVDDGRITAIVDQDAYQIGYQVIEDLVKASKGEKLDKTIPIDVKYVKAADLKAYGVEKSKIKTTETDK